MVGQFPSVFSNWTGGTFSSKQIALLYKGGRAARIFMRPWYRRRPKSILDWNQKACAKGWLQVAHEWQMMMAGRTRCASAAAIPSRGDGRCVTRGLPAPWLVLETTLVSDWPHAREKKVSQHYFSSPTNNSALCCTHLKPSLIRVEP